MVKVLHFVSSLDKDKSKAMSEDNQWEEEGTFKSWCVERKEMRLNNEDNTSMGCREQKM